MDPILLFGKSVTTYAFDYSTVSQYTLNICLHVQLYTYYNVFMNLELAYSVLMNLRLHNNIHVCILNLKVNNISAIFIIMIQIGRAKLS